MVYRSLGKDVPVAQIWPVIRKQNQSGSFSSTTHLMVRDALSRGFAAVAIQARHPLQALRLCRDSGIRAILNHRLKNDATAGHYSVLVDIDEKNVVLHDPLYGPARRLTHAELLALWRRRFPSSEIAGNVLIGISAQSTGETACQLCHTATPSTIECPKCKNTVSLQPAILLGCTSSACAGRMWNYVCCPTCNYTWTFSLQLPQAKLTELDLSNRQVPVLPGVCRAESPETKPAAHSQPEQLNLEELFAALDKFCNHILSLPAATNRPEIKQHLDFIAASKEKLTLALAEQFAHAQVHRERLADLAQTMKQKQEAHRSQMEELTRPSPPLDGNVLGRRLLKNLGLGFPLASVI
jgi:hypothetical protein